MGATFRFLLTLAALASPLGNPLLGREIHASRDPATDEPAITDDDRSHWAFTPLRRSAPPQVRHASQARGPVDRFILAKLEAAGLALQAQADPSTLIRRLSFDLTGLPPSVREVQAFCADPSDRAYEALVDRLLQSPRFGERQAQHWLDVARYAESDGFEHDLERKHAWKYRDWVINAFNRDLPFDEFVRLQIAGDELSPAQAIATGFLFAGPDMPDINNQELRRHEVLNEITGTVGAAFMGLTVACAQCHDHAYDPLSQADFYRLRAVFDNLPPLARDRQLGHAFYEAGNKVPASFVSVRGDYQRPAPTQVSAAFPRIAGARRDLLPEPTDKSSGRRTAFARWLTGADNALLLRATANRLWLSHFGQPLAAQPNDLGRQGEAPTHPELLDWLATELPRQQWSLKALHKQIVMSATYRQSPARQTGASKVDGRAHYAGFPRRRLSGEEVRDAVLLVAGQLNLKAGGESVRLPLPPEVSSRLIKKQQKVTADPSEHQRRSIYVFARRNLRYPLFELFDKPDALMSCGRRNESTTAPQALTLFNSEFSSMMAGKLSDDALKSGSEPGTLVRELSWRCYARPPTEAEALLGRSFLEQHTAHTASYHEAVADYCLALINASAFLFVD